ncbi:MAG: prolyl oligopeptidase family serine peptidase [Alphaproteobacteria bacterium]|nr:prolyl oligopeptidase family serine peptidase [Alphaproteobacteria bacterium]
MRIGFGLAAAVSVIAIAGGTPAIVAAETLEETAARFGIRQTVLQISLSPTGQKIAFIEPGPQGSEILNVIDLVGDATIKPILTNSEQRSDLSRCDWASEERLVCMVDMVSEGSSVLIGFSRVLAIGADGSEPLLLTPRTDMRALGYRQDGGTILALDVSDGDDTVLMTKEYVPERTIGTRLANEASGLGVEEVNVIDGRRKKVENPDSDAVVYIADDKGDVRMKVRHPRGVGSNLGDEQYFYYRGPNKSGWTLLSRVKLDAQTASGFIPVAVDSQRNVAFGFDAVDGYTGVVEVPLDGVGEPRVVMARDDVDVDRLIRIGRQRRVVGASYATEKRAVEYFDADLKTFAAQLQEALPGKPLINIVGASADESRLLIVASSDTDPGMVYLYDRTSRELSEVIPLREHLQNQTMGAMTPVSFPAADGTPIPAYLTLPPGSDGKNLPAIVLPHGGPSARDEWGFDWLVQFFAARGFAVLQPNFRGSAGYGEAWFGRNGFQAWETAIGDVNDAGRWLVREGIAESDRLAVVGWSYGGYAALQSQVLDSSLYQAVVAIAPVTDLDQLRDDARPYTNFGLVDAFIGQGPHVRTGSPAKHAASFAAPVMLFHGTLDQNVAVVHSRMMAKRLKDAGKAVEYVELEGLDHGLADSKARSDMLQHIDIFLNSDLGG